MTKRHIASLTLLAWLLATGPGRMHAQESAASASGGTTGTSDTLALAGHPGQVPLLRLNNKFYVEVEDLARITEGTLAFRPHSLVLTLAGSPAGLPPAPPVPATKQGFSRDFLKAAIEAMGIIREWRAGLVDAIQNNYPIAPDWAAAHRRQADMNLSLVSAAVSTDDDRSGLPLLTAEFANMQKLSDQYIGLRQQATYVNPESIANDPLDQQILTCARSMASMAASNAFVDEPACH